MFRSVIISILFVCGFCLMSSCNEASAQQAYGRNLGTSSTQDWQRFYHYPYVYYPQNYYVPEYFQSSQDMFNRYPAEMRVPAYNKDWINFYPQSRRYHSGGHFTLDIF